MNGTKTILKDRRVSDVEFPPDSDYKFFVYLKPGWHWAGYGTTARGFHNVRDFLEMRYKIERGDPQ